MVLIIYIWQYRLDGSAKEHEIVLLNAYAQMSLCMRALGASSDGSGKSVPSLLDGTISTVPKSHVLVQLLKTTIRYATCTVYFNP